jgi:sigma-B regulation protein RsbU (phosphoserine phosphatase)
MALASIKQREVQRRLDALHEDLAAAGEIQRFLMPPDRGTVGGVNYAVWSRPGRMVSGDLFSITDCGDGRVAFFLGDVMGKGLGAGLIMSGVISFLHCMLRNTSDPAEALSRLNDYLCPRLIDGRFVSLWLGIIDAKHGVLTAADAGHGYALIVPPGAVPTRLECSGGTPIAAADHCRYTNTTLAFEQGSRLVLYSDGIVEQRSPANEPFGTDRLSRSIDGSSSSGDDVTRISRAVEAFIGGAAASDDLTVASIALRA